MRRSSCSRTPHSSSVDVIGVSDAIDATEDAGDARTLAVPLLGADGEVLGTFVGAIFPASDRAEVNRVVRTLLLVAGIVLVLGCVAAWTIAGRVLRPVRQLTRATRNISASDLTTQIPVEGDDELAELGHNFNGMLDRLDESFRGQRAFLDDVAHELRTPITIVRGHLEVLGDDPQERAETVALVTDELDRMARYVGDLLLVARASSPDFLQLDLVDLGALVDGALVRASALAPRDWAQASTLGDGKLLVLADGERLMQAVLALATNAVQHTHEGDRITIGADAVDDHVRLWVADTGPGVDAADHQRIFERFSRAIAPRCRARTGRASACPSSPPLHGLTVATSSSTAASAPGPRSESSSLDRSNRRKHRDPHSDCRRRGPHRVVPGEGTSLGRLHDAGGRRRDRRAARSPATTASTCWSSTSGFPASPATRSCSECDPGATACP